MLCRNGTLILKNSGGRQLQTERSFTRNTVSVNIKCGVELRNNEHFKVIFHSSLFAANQMKVRQFSFLALV